MKVLFLALALFASAASAEAAISCRTYFGTNVSVSTGNNRLYIRFAGGRYPNAALTANGASGSSFYFRSMGSTAIVQKQVLSGGRGKIWYYFPVSGGNHDHEDSVALSCN